MEPDRSSWQACHYKDHGGLDLLRPKRVTYMSSWEKNIASMKIQQET